MDKRPQDDASQTAAQRADEAAAAWNRGDFNEAAKCYLYAAEQLDRAAQAAREERRTDLNTAATNMRARCADAIRRRDTQEKARP